jgi:hypothetical protein
MLANTDITTKLITTDASLTLVAALSMVSSGGVALVMNMNRKLFQHPNTLVFYMCICEAIVANASLFELVSAKWIICNSNLDSLLSTSLLHTYSKKEAHNLLRSSNTAIIDYF